MSGSSLCLTHTSKNSAKKPTKDEESYDTLLATIKQLQKERDEKAAKVQELEDTISIMQKHYNEKDQELSEVKEQVETLQEDVKSLREALGCGDPDSDGEVSEIVDGLTEIVLKRRLVRKDEKLTYKYQYIPKRIAFIDKTVMPAIGHNNYVQKILDAKYRQEDENWSPFAYANIVFAICIVIHIL